MAERRAKRQRTSHASVYYDSVPLTNDYDYHDVQSREGRLRRVGNTVRTAFTTRSPERSANLWADISTWAIPDDLEYALDPNGELYDAMVDGEIAEEAFIASLAPDQSKRQRSRVSKRPHLVWRDLHRQTYLDEMIRWAGRGDFLTARHCPDCIARNVTTTLGTPEFHCEDCFLPDLSCLSCCLKRHRVHPFHRIERWDGNKFARVSLKSMGLTVQLNHGSLFCSNPVSCHASMVVLHTTGLHEVAIKYCGCDRAVPHHIQLLRRGLYPASQISVKTCASFQLLELLHKFSLATKASTYDFYRALEKLTVNTGLNVPKSRYRALFRMNSQYRHLKMLKWAGRGHDPSGVEGTQPGELAVLCPSCPRPGINLPADWEKGPKFLYMMFLCMDANFRLKNQLVSSYSQDPGLGTGWSYMVPRAPYEAYVLSRTNDQDISTCVGLQALAQANRRYSEGLRFTGVGGVMCGRSEMIMPLGIGNLHKGERYSNMDYVFGSALRFVHVALILISYDIACQWFINLWKRIVDHWPEEIKITSSTNLIPAIPKLHEPMHETANHQVYSLNFIPGVGASDLEVPERIWGSHNPLANSTKTQGPGTRHDNLDDNFGFWNWLKYAGLGVSLARKYKRAIADRNIQHEGHRGLTASLDSELVRDWERICVEWEEDEFPKKQKNPYHAEGTSMSESEVRKALATEEEKLLRRNAHSANETSASAFVILGLELEELQRRIQRLAKTIKDKATARQSGGLTEQRNILRTRLRAWEKLFPVYMPGLLQYQSKIQTEQAPGPKVLGPRPNPEDEVVWLPSKIPSSNRKGVVADRISDIEDRLRVAQAADSLDAIRHVLKLKTRMIYFKNKNVRGQRDGTRSRAVIDRVYAKAIAGADKYRAAREAKMSLSGPGDWENTYRILDNKDIRGYQDPDRLRQRTGRKGTLEDALLEQVAKFPETEAQSEAELSLEVEERRRRDGTGETRRTLSWIWTTKPPGEDDEADDILRVEWSKSRARATRANEEVMLVKEEMRRVLTFLEWRAQWWRDRQVLKQGVPKDFEEGLAAYAQGQANLQEELAESFRVLWKAPLNSENNANNTNTSHGEGASDEDDGDGDGGESEDGPEDVESDHEQGEDAPDED